MNPKELSVLIPSELDLDLYNGAPWISLVAFAVKNLRPHYLPSLPPISNFYEINMRTYVRKENKVGIYFLSIEAEKRSSVLLARSITGLPYIKSFIKHNGHTYLSCNNKIKANLGIEYNPLSMPYIKDDLDRWLTERYCVFNKMNDHLFKHEVHHIEWPLQAVNLSAFKMHYTFGNLSFHDLNHAKVHYSRGVNVLTWNRERL